jgi:hypothetical protein
MRAGQPHSPAPHPNRSLIRIASSLVQTVPFLKRAERQNCVVIRNKVSRNTGLSWSGLVWAVRALAVTARATAWLVAAGSARMTTRAPVIVFAVSLGAIQMTTQPEAAGRVMSFCPSTGWVPCTGRGRRSPGYACCPAGTGRARRCRPRRPPVLGVEERRRPGEAGRAGRTRAALRRSLVGHPVSAGPTFRQCPWTTARRRTRCR